MKTLIVITGPTGIGKTATAIAVAQQVGAEIISADSRQIYRGIPIGTAAPTEQERKAVPHHFVEFKNLEEYYSAAQFEVDAIQKISQLHSKSDYVVMCGGSMLYVDAVCKGIDDIPTISADVREAVIAQYQAEGLEGILGELKRLDEQYYNIVDKNNAKRIIHAIEICRQSGVPYSSLRTGQCKERDFRIVKVALNVERELLFARINQRVEKMIEAGLEQEARGVYHLRNLNSLNTVGYKEMFAYFDGTMDFVTAKERIKKNTRVYAKKQLTWYAKDDSIVWLRPEDAKDEILKLIER